MVFAPFVLPWAHGAGREVQVARYQARRAILALVAGSRRRRWFAFVEPGLRDVEARHSQNAAVLLHHCRYNRGMDVRVRRVVQRVQAPRRPH
eukprot:329500-Chlamydomonas_euryale.AAC.1